MVCNVPDHIFVVVTCIITNKRTKVVVVVRVAPIHVVKRLEFLLEISRVAVKIL